VTTYYISTSLKSRIRLISNSENLRGVWDNELLLGGFGISPAHVLMLSDDVAMIQNERILLI